VTGKIKTNQHSNKACALHNSQRVHPEFLTGEVFTVKVHHLYYHFGDKYFEGKGFLDLVGHYLPPDIRFVRNSGCTLHKSRCVPFSYTGLSSHGHPPSRGKCCPIIGVLQGGGKMRFYWRLHQTEP